MNPIKAMISRHLVQVSSALQRRLAVRRQSIAQQNSFAQRLWTVIALFVLQACSLLIQAVGILLLPSGASFQQFYEIQDGKGYTSSFSQYKSWKQRVQFVSLTSMVLVVATVGMTYFAFVDPRGSAAASCTISSNQDITPTYISTNSCASITISAGALLNFSGGAIDLQGNGTFTIDSGVDAIFLDAMELNSTDTLQVNGNILAPAADPDGLVITAENVTVAASGTINADGAGCETTSAGNGYGPDTGGDGSCTQGTTYGGGDETGGGGAHGGNSGQGSQNSAPVSPYGSANNPQYLGASGAGDSSTAGVGGGRMTLTVADTLDIDGSITANGSDANGGVGGYGSGGGAGGAIYIDASTVSGSGSIQALGGGGGDVANVNQQGGGGSGGRVAVFYDTDPESLVSGLDAAVDAAGGNPGAGAVVATAGSDGSVYTAQYTVPNAPTFSQPSNGATGRSRTPSLVTSNYNANGRSHTSTDWQIADANTFNAADIVWSATDATSNLETITANSTTGSFQNDLSGKTVLAPNTQYYLRARHTNSVGDSNWASTISFTTTSNVKPNTPTTSSPSDGASNVGNNPTLSASSFSDGDGDNHKTSDWFVYPTDDCTGTAVWSAEFSEEFESVVVNAANGTFSGQLSGQTQLPDGYTYSFKVRYTDDYLGNSNYSNCASFSTEDVGTAPTFSGPLPDVSFAYTKTSSPFDLNDYFTDADGDALTYSVTGNSEISVTFANGVATFSAEDGFTGNETLTFTASDGSLTASSNEVLVTVYEPSTSDNLESISGSNKGAGTVTVKLKDGTEKTWTAFTQGGAVPRVAYGCNEDLYVTVTKKKAGRALKVFDGEGELLTKKRVSVKMRPRELAIGELNAKCKTIEIVNIAKRGKKKVSLKVLQYNENTNTLKFRKRKLYSRKKLKKKTLVVSMKERKIYVKTKNGRQLLVWKPFKN